MDKIVGIDLGTSTSEIAVLEDGKPIVILNRERQKITLSVVGKSEDGEIIVGRDARDQMLLRPMDTVMEVKRNMGSKVNVLMGGKTYSPQEISAFILKYLKECAEEYLGGEVQRAVITVPAYFTDEQRRATVEAGKLAGFKVERIINEPTAAALCYGIDNMDNNHHVLVYDLGGGTLDVTLLEMFQGVLEVKASSGNNQLGGKDFDQRMIDVMINEFKEKNEIDLCGDNRAMARIKAAAEACKIALSQKLQYEVVLPFIAEKDGNPIALEHTFTRQNFESLITDLIESTEEPIKVVLKDAKMMPEQIDTVLLVGGSTRIPYVKKYLQKLLGKEPQSLVDPDLAVVMGAAIQAGILNRELSDENDILITDVCPYTLGVETLGFVGSFPVPDVYDIIIPRNTTIPVAREKTYATVMDDQKQVEIKVYQGDYKKASMNNFLGKFMLSGIPPAPAYKEKIKISFIYDVNGILHVEAVILSNGEKASIAIETTGVEMEQEMDLSSWKEAPKAKKYRSILRRAERLITEDENSLLLADLEDLVKDFKKALINDEEVETLEELEECLTELLFDLEEDK